jgi:RNA polymerase sigma factor (sigma-70 family)
MKDYNIKLSVRNNKLLNLMKMFDIKNASELSRRIGGYHQSHIGNAINLKCSAYSSNGNKTRLTELLCDYFNVLPEDLFPFENLYSKLNKNTVEIELDFEEMIKIAPNDRTLIAPPTYEESTLPVYEAIDNALLKLTPQSSEVIKHRFGLDGYSKKTLSEVAAIYNISNERIRQIEVKALRRLKHPKISDSLPDLI